MKKIIIALFLVLLTVGLCVSCDGTVDEKLLNPRKRGGIINPVNVYKVNPTISCIATLEYCWGWTWEESVAAGMNQPVINISGSHVQYQGHNLYYDNALTSPILKTDTTTYPSLGDAIYIDSL